MSAQPQAAVRWWAGFAALAMLGGLAQSACTDAAVALPLRSLEECEWEEV